MVELTLNWNHVTQVLGPNGNITYPAQLLPMMIGALSFARICWLLFKRWHFPEPDCCEENEHQVPQQQKTAIPPQPTFETFKEVVSPLSSSFTQVESTNADVGKEQDTSLMRTRGPVKRYLVAYLPWLSQFDSWKSPKAHHGSLQSSVEEGGENQHQHHSP